VPRRRRAQRVREATWRKERGQAPHHPSPHPAPLSGQADLGSGEKERFRTPQTELREPLCAPPRHAPLAPHRILPSAPRAGTNLPLNRAMARALACAPPRARAPSQRARPRPPPSPAPPKTCKQTSGGDFHAEPQCSQPCVWLVLNLCMKRQLVKEGQLLGFRVKKPETLHDPSSDPR
jgi:hypothetical protein